MKLYKKIFYYILALSVVFILVIAGKYFLLVFLSALGLWLGRNITEKEKKVEEGIKTQYQYQTELLKRTEELEGRLEQLKKSAKERREGRSKNLFLLVILVTFRVMLSEPVLAVNDLYIPESYEELKELYILVDQEVRERDELISEYQVLVEDYKEALLELNLLVEQLQEINSQKDMTIVVKDEIIALQKKPTWGISGGLTIGGKLGYTLGISRVRDWWGWLIHYSTSGSLNVGLSIYL